MISSLFTLGLAASAVASPVRRATPALKVTVSAPAQVDSADNLYTVVELTNAGDAAVEVNALGTAFSSIETHDFVIDGQAASGAADVPAFVGATARYLSDVAALRSSGALIKLAAGESKTVNTTLGSRYDFTQSGTGTYTIATNPEFAVVAADSNDFETVTAAVQAATVDLQGTLVSKKVANKGGLQKRISYASCSSSQQPLISAAASAAQSGSVTTANSLPATSTAYTTWFGAWTSARAATAKSVYTKMNGLFTGLKYDCSCNEAGVYAYVYPNDDSTIYLCPVFWQVGTSGFDSKADTLIHETSHYDSVGGTDDVTYGQANCKALAQSNPASAIRNADNYAYYFDAVTV